MVGGAASRRRPLRDAIAPLSSTERIDRCYAPDLVDEETLSRLAPEVGPFAWNTTARRVTIVVGAARADPFLACCGIRQGCPQSAVPFCFAADGLIRAVAMTLGPAPNVVTGYLDDLNLVVVDLLRQLPPVVALFRRFQAFSNSTLNFGKC